MYGQVLWLGWRCEEKFSLPVMNRCSFLRIIVDRKIPQTHRAQNLFERLQRQAQTTAL